VTANPAGNLMPEEVSPDRPLSSPTESLSPPKTASSGASAPEPPGELGNLADEFRSSGFTRYFCRIDADEQIEFPCCLPSRQGQKILGNFPSFREILVGGRTRIPLAPYYLVRPAVASPFESLIHRGEEE